MHTTYKSQLSVALLALVGVMFLSWDAIRAQLRNVQLPVQNEIHNVGLEHTKPLSVRFEYTSKSGAALVQILHEDGDANAAIYVPDTWERKEVRGVDIGVIASGSPSFGFVEWPLPAGASYQFFIPKEPRTILVHNPSGERLKVSLIKFNLETSQLEQNVMLLQSDTAKLW